MFFRATCISKEIDKLLGNGDIVLGKDICIKPNLLSFAGMAVLKDLSLVLGKNPVPPANMVEFTGLTRHGTLPVIEAEETAVFLVNWGSVLVVEKARFSKLLQTSTVLEFLLFVMPFASESAGRGHI